MGLIYAPHTSAGRLPTELGLRFFIDTLMEVGDLSEEERERIDHEVKAAGDASSVETVLSEAGHMLSGAVARRRRRARREAGHPR